MPPRPLARAHGCVRGFSRQHISHDQRYFIVTVARRLLRTFDNQTGRNVFYRAAIHPMTAPLTAGMIQSVAKADSVAVYDPAGYFTDLAAMHDLGGWKVDCVYVQRIEEVGQDRAGFAARPLTEIAESPASLIFVADFDGERLLTRLGPYRPKVERSESLDAIRLLSKLDHRGLEFRTRIDGPLCFARSQLPTPGRVLTRTAPGSQPLGAVFAK